MAMRGPEVAKSRALSKLLENHRLFLAFLARRVGTKTDAEDILQTALMKMIEKPATLHDDERVVPWFYQVLRNALSDHYRRRDAEERALRVAARAAEPFRALELDPELESAVCRCVTSLLPTLKREYAEILRTVDLRGRKMADVAKGAGISAGAARVRLHRARRALQRRLERTCGPFARHGCPDCACRVEAHN